jgi:hypothetical protein
MNDDEFFINDDELNAEGQLSIADKEKIKVLETMNKKISEAIENLKYSEKEEFRASFAVIARYVGAILDIEGLEQNPEISEEQLLEAIEKIELSVKELSFQDLREYQKKNSQKDDEDTEGDEPSGPDLKSNNDNFDF